MTPKCGHTASGHLTYAVQKTFKLYFSIHRDKKNSYLRTNGVTYS